MFAVAWKRVGTISPGPGRHERKPQFHSINQYPSAHVWRARLPRYAPRVRSWVQLQDKKLFGYERWMTYSEMCSSCVLVVLRSGYKQQNYIKRILKSNPITGLDRPLGFQEVEAPRFFRQSAHEGGKVVSPTHQPPLPPRKYSWYSFLKRIL
jgi:hypothetical protein